MTDCANCGHQIVLTLSGWQHHNGGAYNYPNVSTTCFNKNPYETCGCRNPIPRKGKR